MTPNLQMEQLSLAYIRAVAASAGYQVTRPEPDVDSVDGVLMSSRGRRPRIEFQAKADSRNLLRPDGIHFPLPVKNYEELRIDSWTPRLLVVVLIPEEEEQRLSQTEEELCLRYCGYWLFLGGKPAIPNASTVTVVLPAANIFNKSQLNVLMNKVETGSPLC